MLGALLLVTQIAQFGSGLQPPTEKNIYSPPEVATDATGKTALNVMTTMISNVIAIATVAAGIFFIVHFLLAAYAWLMSEGDSGKLQKARNQMIHAVIGLALAVGAYAIIGLVGSLIGLDILNPAQLLSEVAPNQP